jgi:hypothetical protein
VIKVPVRDGGSNCFGLGKRVLEVGDLLSGRFSASTRKRDLICREMSLIQAWGMLTTASGGSLLPLVLPSLMKPGFFAAGSGVEPRRFCRRARVLLADSRPWMSVRGRLRR